MLKLREEYNNNSHPTQKILERIERAQQRFDQKLELLLSNVFEKEIPLIRSEFTQEINEILKSLNIERPQKDYKDYKENKGYPY